MIEGSERNARSLTGSLAALGGICSAKSKTQKLYLKEGLRLPSNNYQAFTTPPFWLVLRSAEDPLVFSSTALEKTDLQWNTRTRVEKQLSAPPP